MTEIKCPEHRLLDSPSNWHLGCYYFDSADGTCHNDKIYDPVCPYDGYRPERCRCCGQTVSNQILRIQE